MQANSKGLSDQMLCKRLELPEYFCLKSCLECQQLLDFSMIFLYYMRLEVLLIPFQKRPCLLLIFSSAEDWPSLPLGNRHPHHPQNSSWQTVNMSHESSIFLPKTKEDLQRTGKQSVTFQSGLQLLRIKQAYLDLLQSCICLGRQQRLFLQVQIA